MSKIYFIPDVHLQEYSPRSRKDSYPTTILEKLEYIVDYVNNNDGQAIFLGDLFNAVNMPMIYFYRIVDTFKKFNKVPLICIGNHDFPRDNPDLLPRTPLGLLKNIGLIDYLQQYIVPNRVIIEGKHYWQPITKSDIIDDSIKKICVAHCFYEDSFAQDHNLHSDDILNLNYDYYILGHDHTPYDDLKINNSTIFRIGSLSRGTANEKQLIRDKVYILEYDTELDLFIKVPVPCLPAKDIFNDSIFLRKEEKQLDTQQVLDNLVFKSNDSIYDVLDASDYADDIKGIVEEYLQGAGIFRINIKD